MGAPDAPVSPLANRPLSDRTREALLEAIDGGRFPAGRLPPEPALADMLGVSRTTLRAALQSLSADGLVSRRRRHGTHVNPRALRSSMRLDSLVSFMTLIEQCGHKASTDPQTQRVVPLSGEQADALGRAPGEDALLVRRLLRAGGEPVISVGDVIPLAHLRVEPDAVRVADTTFAFLAANAVAAAEYATSEFVPRVVSGTAPGGLTVGDGMPYIELREVHYTTDHERVALSVVCVDDRFVRLSLLRRGG